MIWNYRQYDTVAAIAQLGALTFNIGRPGTGTGRVGGHQEGYARPDYPGPKPPPDVDKYVQDGKGKVFWITGCNPYLAAQNNARFRKRVGERAQKLTDHLSLAKRGAGEPASMQALADRILDGLDKTGGLFVTVQNIYMIESARDAHLILPAAQWGEAENISLNCGDRLLRLDDRFMDPPGDAKPDWEIHGMVGQKLEALYKAEGKDDIAKRFAGMDWAHGADVVKSIQDKSVRWSRYQDSRVSGQHVGPRGFQGSRLRLSAQGGPEGHPDPGAHRSANRRPRGYQAVVFDLLFHDQGREIQLVWHPAVG